MGRKPRKADLSLDDPRWVRVREVYKLLSHRSGRDLAVLDMNEALADNRVRAMRRNIETGEGERLLSKYWVDFKLSLWLDEGLLVVPHRKDDRGRVNPVRGFMHFLWNPDAATVWPSLRQADDEVAPMGATPGTKPTGDWPTLVAAWLILKACEDQHQLENIDALVEGAQDYLQKEIDWAPKNTGRIRTKILDFLQLVRR